MLNIVPLPYLCVPSEVDELSPSSSQEVAQAEGFGKLYPSARPSQQRDEHSEDEQDLASGVISRKELEKGRLSRDGKHNPLKQQGGRVAAPSPHGKGGASYWHPFCLQLARFSHFYVGLLCFHLLPPKDINFGICKVTLSNLDNSFQN